jgi:hypothetical protein
VVVGSSSSSSSPPVRGDGMKLPPPSPSPSGEAARSPDILEEEVEGNQKTLSRTGSRLRTTSRVMVRGGVLQEESAERRRVVGHPRVRSHGRRASDAVEEC